jgi:hypothetical protein
MRQQPGGTTAAQPHSLRLQHQKASRLHSCQKAGHCCKRWQHADCQAPAAAAGDRLAFERRSASHMVLHVSVTQGTGAGKEVACGAASASDSDGE